MYLNIFFAVLIGGLVGAAGHISKEGRIIKPRKTKKFIYLGYLEEVILGGLAAACLVTFYEPDSAFKVVSLSIIAGLGGDTLLKCLEFLKLRKEDRNQ
ncbi:DUF4257 domain-containing protein [Bacillus sp. DTU_2020_1000418_1_SI_GHA_SEK_038]|uniref:DUF4257 domain-containing protein n=1 Tax=Bacillus sp. DTU_2020_1000418_1_SI_GHA_SEK_038 TaxID=3077585 RepID=UPI0028E7224A|nr:DUF4257 domain-containing protein [Bacillus sp. DTU_2020_1000418_1_SI_GHA_SEK_038]WNS77264.1 DUF4257 domain-containing protein [Bacillus sp. DTU_2020_1000418_1_SI_GHA_SEK_038]